MRKIYLLGLFYVGMSLVYLMRADEPGVIPDDPPVTVTTPDDPPVTVTITVDDPPAVDPLDAGSWFRGMKAYCNPVEVETRLTWSPAPQRGLRRLRERTPTRAVRRAKGPRDPEQACFDVCVVVPASDTPTVQTNEPSCDRGSPSTLRAVTCAGEHCRIGRSRWIYFPCHQPNSHITC